MTVKTIVEYKPEEIDTIVKMLEFLSICDDQGNHEIETRINAAFSALADLLCMDPKGEEAFEQEGW